LALGVESPCTDDADFGRRVTARSSKLAISAEDEAVPVRTTANTDGLVDGTMRIGSASEPTAPPSVRHVVGATCEEVVDALALVVALTFDPEAIDGPLPAPRPTPPAATPAPRPPPPSRIAPGKPMTVGPPANRQDAWPWAIGVHGLIAAIDQVPVGASLFTEMARGRGLFTLTARLALSAYGAEVERASRGARLIWVFADPQVCLLRFHVGVLSVFPCATISLGLLTSGPSRGVVRPHGFTRAWIAPGAVARARLELSSRLGLELESALSVPLARDRYAFGTEEAYRVPVVVPSAGIGIAFKLP
jgi:hypothetical protein